MSEVVKKLVTELGYKIVDQDKIKKYSNTAKDILKTQKETNKVRSKEKDILKDTDALFNKYNKDKKKDIETTAKNLNKIFNDLDKQTKKQESTAKTVNNNKTKLNNGFQKTLLKDLKNIEGQEKKVRIEKEKALKQFKKLNEQTTKDLHNKAANRQYILNVLNGEHNKILKERATLEKNNLKSSLDADIQRAISRQKEFRVNQEIIKANRAGAYDRKLNFGAGQRGQTFDTRMNDILARKGKMIDPNNPNRIINIPTQSRYTYPTTAEKQGAREDVVTNVGQRVSDVSYNVLKDSADTFLKFSNQMKELEVFGDIKDKKTQQELKTQILASALKYGYKPTDVAEVGVGYSLAGVSGGALKNITEVTTGTARAGRTTPQKAEEVLNNLAHQYGVDFNKFGEVAKMADAVITVMNKSKLGFEDVNIAMKYFGPIAHQAGMSLEDTLTMVGLWSQRGIKGSTPGTSGRQAILKAAQELEGMWASGKGLKTKKTSTTDKGLSLEDMGITKKTVLDKGGKFNLFKLLDQIRAYYKKKPATGTKKLADLKEVFGVIPSSALATLLEDYSKMDLELINAMKKPEGAREKTAGALMQSPQMKVQQAQSQIEIAKINLGTNLSSDIALLTELSNKISEIFNKSPQIQMVTSELLKIGLVGGALLGATTGIRLLALAMGLPVFAVGGTFLLGIGAITAGLYVFFDSFKGKDSMIAGVTTNITNSFNAMSQSLMPSLQGITDTFQNLLNKAYEFMGLDLNKTGTIDIKVNGGQQFGFSGLPSSPRSGASYRDVQNNKSTASRAG